MKILIVALVVAMLFLAGCPGAGTQGGQAAGGAQQGAGTQQGGALGGASGGATGGAGTSSGSGTASGGSSGGNDFANWDFAAMQTLGQPIYCEVDYAETGFSGSYKMYMKGENIRVETTTNSEGQMEAATTIMKGKKIYIQYSEPADMGNGVNCEWVYMDMDKIDSCMPENTEVEGSTEVEKYEETPDNYHCEYGTFGDEKFTTPSVPSTCDLSQQLCDAYEAMAEMENSGYGDAMAACEGLEGEAFQACLEAQFGGYQ